VVVDQRQDNRAGPDITDPPDIEYVLYHYFYKIKHKDFIKKPSNINKRVPETSLTNRYGWTPS
jgi:hypothetical protein